MMMRDRWVALVECDLPCSGCSGNCDYKGFRYSMENVHVEGGPSVLYGSTKLNSEVPVPYFSWYDFGFMTQYENNFL